jgi:putative Mg2+ transporter-C (MgtC) family protein
MAIRLMELELTDIAYRVGAAFVTGVLLGYERENHGRAAGLRTVVLVTTASALAMILSEVFYRASEPGGIDPVGWRPDPARLAAGVLAGMGFIGAGVILRLGNLVRGVTTASVLWLATVLGLCFGGGQFELGAGGLVLALLTLYVLPQLEQHIQNDWYAQVTVTLALDGATVQELGAVIETSGVRVKSVELDHNVANGTRVVRFQLKFKRTDLINLPAEVVAHVVRAPGVLRAQWS